QALGRDPLSCREFLERHSEYLDGQLPALATREFDQHVRLCESCSRYDRVLRRGLLLARNLGEVQPSANFQEKLHARLMRLEDEPVQRPIVAGLGTAVVIAAVLALVAITPVLRMIDERATAESAQRSPVVNGATPIPLVVEPLSFPPPQITKAVFVSHSALSTYTPVVIQPPVMQSEASAPRLITYPLQPASER
ncbi:MAG TPA: zf-HC2 domain-containing protein, partial [Longimicrobiales bacterium]|nr:zf-HC2 domain-containing protein [Longimicrobiales bacterium]